MKYRLFDFAGGDGEMLARGGMERVTDHAEAIEQVLTELKEGGWIASEADLAAYAYGLLACHAYQVRFAEALENPGPRMPLTTCSVRWKNAVVLGRRLLWLGRLRSRETRHATTVRLHKR